MNIMNKISEKVEIEDLKGQSACTTDCLHWSGATNGATSGCRPVHSCSITCAL